MLAFKAQSSFHRSRPRWEVGCFTPQRHGVGPSSGPARETKANGLGVLPTVDLVGTYLTAYMRSLTESQQSQFAVPTYRTGSRTNLEALADSKLELICILRHQSSILVLQAIPSLFFGCAHSLAKQGNDGPAHWQMTNFSLSKSLPSSSSKVGNRVLPFPSPS